MSTTEQTIEGRPGEHISTVSERAVNLAKKTGCDVAFYFNDTRVIAHPTDATGDVVARWQTAFEMAAEAFRRSPAGVRSAILNERERKRAQDVADSVMEELPSAAGNLDTVLPLMAKLADAIRTDTKWEPAKAAAILERAGYVKDEYVGHTPKSDFDTNAVTLGRWIAGQCIEWLQMGMPPHGVTIKFVNEYLKLRADQANAAG